MLLDNKAARVEDEYYLMEKAKTSKELPKRDCKEFKGVTVCHGHYGFTMLLDKKVQEKVRAVAKRSILMFPQSNSKKKSNKLVKEHDSMAQIFQGALGITVVDTSGKDYKDRQTFEAFATFLQDAKSSEAAAASAE
eukprot:TRINITY_DN70020_c0_g1_i1.p1 TRINITY_DN70020_c0_g1~~TRINITY_DN70020_c0_g1_i1.p1  ORF type:complete len:144 (-),score=40.40 TRINITY_DN70020_c0_g1_i1:9-416(-)